MTGGWLGVVGTLMVRHGAPLGRLDVEGRSGEEPSWVKPKKEEEKTQNHELR